MGKFEIRQAAPPLETTDLTQFRYLIKLLMKRIGMKANPALKLERHFHTGYGLNYYS